MKNIGSCNKCGGNLTSNHKCPDVSLSTELPGSTHIKLPASDGVGLSAFHYWYTCPECKYVWIRMQDNYCGGCGRKVEVMAA